MRTFPVLVVVGAWLAATVAVPAAPAWLPASPTRLLRFPADHASHPAYKTEWWYYTGHLTGESGHRYGYELTFFRQGVDRSPTATSAWHADQVYLAHFAITDIDWQRFQYRERINRPGLGIAGAETARYRTWNDDWIAQELGSTHQLSARDGDMALDLLLDSTRPPVAHGDHGYSRKGSCASCASHYYSLTRLGSRGWLTLGGKAERVTGLSWMDHEFGSGQLEADQRGWDWFSLQVSDGSDLMLYRLRRQDGTVVPESSGTFVAPDGRIAALRRDQTQLKTTATWRSPASRAVYPMAWTLAVPSQGLQLDVTPSLQNQELQTRRSTGVTYWEGAVTARGTHHGKAVTGQGYVEMTGYAAGDRPRF